MMYKSVYPVAANNYDVLSLYEKYVTPLERDYRGKYVAVSYKGQIIIGWTLLEVMKVATDAFGKGQAIIFKVGEQSIDTLTAA